MLYILEMNPVTMLLPPKLEADVQMLYILGHFVANTG